jgi:hypothetical protein
MLRLAQARHGHIWHGSADEVIQKRSFAAVQESAIGHRADIKLRPLFGCYRVEADIIASL